MRIKKVVKRLVALGAGATMLGATVMGAMAADLSSYPDSFQTDGVFNGYFVVGEAAKPIDNLAMTDIATGMWYSKPGETTTTTVEGDAWEVGTAAEWLELNESVGPSGTSGIVDYIDSSDLGALADGEFTSSKGTFKYEQKLHFDAFGPRAQFLENEDDEIDVFWKITDGEQIAKYELDFTTDLETDIDTSDSYSLDDMEDKKITFMGTEWTITTATGAVGSGTIKLTFMGGATTGTLDEGESQTFAIGDTDYEITLTYTSATQAAFTVNGESTSKLEDGETFTLADGSEFGVSDLLYQDYAGGIHQATFFIGANKLYMTDQINDTTYSSTELKVNEETIDGAAVLIKGSVVTAAGSTTSGTDGELKIDYIHINMTAQDDIYLATGEKLSEDSELEEPELLFTENWDFEYQGFDESVKTNDIKLKKAGDDKYELEFTSNDGNVVDLPLVYGAATDALYLGKKAGDHLAMTLNNITDDDYFVLSSKQANALANSDAITTVLQYQSSKNNGDDVQTIKFRNLNTGGTIERTFDDNCVFDISLNGRTHTFDSVATGATNCTADNWPIRLTSTNFSNAVDVINDVNATTNRSSVYLRDASGALITVQYQVRTPSDYAWSRAITPGATEQSLLVNVSVTDTTKMDDVIAAAQDEIVYNLTATSTNEVTSSRLVSPAWTAADPDDTDVTWGYTTYGSKLEHVAASSTPVEFTLAVPEIAGKVVAYITSGAATISTAAGGELALVQVVDATKLDTEVADAGAQNLVVVGGPCVNSVAASLLGNPADCAEGFSPGKARLKMIDSGAGNLAMLVAGYSGEDTRLAGKVVAHRYGELSGEEMEVSGTTWSDASLGAPVVVEEVVEEVEEEAEEVEEEAEEVEEEAEE